MIKASEKRCPKCNHKNPEKANFCELCGTKLDKTCVSCWIKGGQPYSCTFDKCPGYRLHVLELKTR